tara:strand:- start:645 stop:821 length:177 start_codon:yes stop_codon:yes gene_type:complete
MNSRDFEHVINALKQAQVEPNIVLARAGIDRAVFTLESQYKKRMVAERLTSELLSKVR